MQPCVKFETNGQIEVDDLVRMLEYNGGTNFFVQVTTGSAGEGVKRHFIVEFNDTGDAHSRRRYLHGFHAFPNDKNEEGWTRVQLGADERAAHYMTEIGLELGGKMFDDRDGSRHVLEARPSYGMVA